MLKDPGGLGDPKPSRRVFLAVGILFFLLAGYRIARLSIFMLDVEKTDYAFTPYIRPLADPDLKKPFFPKHNCFTAYIVGAHLAANRVENIYLPDQYRDPAEETDIHREIGEALTVDTFQYPPPFLLLPRLILSVSDGFFTARSIWFVLNILTFSVAVIALALWTGKDAPTLAWFVWPFVLLAPTTLGTLQIENVHFLILSLCVLGMLAMETRREWLGGALLGYAILSKIFPGVLLLYLILRRRWSALIRTCVAMTALLLITVLSFGTQPFREFVKFQAPRLANGEAFWFMRECIRAFTANLSSMGAAYKLERLGLLGEMSGEFVANVFAWVTTAILICVAVLAGIKHRRRLASQETEHLSSASRLSSARVWLVLLILAQLCSPFLPWVYGTTAVLWLLVLLAPIGGGWSWRIVWLTFAWFVFAFNVPLPFGPETASFDLAFTLGAYVIVVGLCLVTFLFDMIGKQFPSSDRLPSP